MNEFIFMCGDCRCIWADETFDDTIESECPNCGNWEYAEKEGAVE